jgi:hypothetical protein
MAGSSPAMTARRRGFSDSRRAPISTPILARSTSVTPERYSRSPSGTPLFASLRALFISFILAPALFRSPRTTLYFLRSRTPFIFVTLRLLFISVTLGLDPRVHPSPTILSRSARRPIAPATQAASRSPLPPRRQSAARFRPPAKSPARGSPTRPRNTPAPRRRLQYIPPAE